MKKMTDTQLAPKNSTSTAFSNRKTTNEANIAANFRSEAPTRDISIRQ